MLFNKKILHIKDEITKNKKFLFLSILTSFLVFIPNFILFTTLNHLIIISIFTFLLFLISIINRFLYTLLSLYILISSIIFSHIYIHWGYKTIDSRLEVALLSPQYEQLEYLQSYLNIADIFVFSYFIFSIYFLYILNRIKIKFTNVKYINFLLVSTLLTLITIYKNPFVNILPFNIMNKYIQMKDRISKINIRTEYLKNISLPSYNKIKHFDYDKIIIVIGESASKNHMEIYGYNKQTTPFFKSLEGSNFHIFNAIASANQTRYALAIDLTDATVKNFEKFFTSPSIVTTFKQYGYNTYWISNQGKAGKHETYVTSIANEADHRYFLNINYHLSKTDMEIIKTLDKINIKKEKKQVFFLHLIGSHFDYKSRYLKNKSLINSPENIIDEYDNSIYFTDFILSKIYQKFNDEKTLFIYFSDHGEVVNKNKFGHGFIPPFKDEYDIPLIIHSNIPNKKILSLKNKRINMETFNHFIKYIANIENNISLISTSDNIMVLEPKNIYKYETLKKYQKQVN